MTDHPSLLIEASAKVYRSLFWLYPADHRKEYGWLMVQLYADQARDTYQRDGDVGMMLYWLKTILDLFISVIQERREKGFTVSFEFLGKLRSPLIMLGGVLIAMSAYGQLKPYDWYIKVWHYDLADTLMAPGLTLFGFGLLGVMIANRDLLPPMAKLGVVSVFIAAVGMSILSIVEATSNIALFDDIGWPLFVLSIMTIFLGLTVFSVTMLRKGYRVAALLIPHPILFTATMLFSMTQEYQDSVGPYWDMFFLIVSWGLTLTLVGYLFRKEIVLKPPQDDYSFIVYQTTQEI